MGNILLPKEREPIDISDIVILQNIQLQLDRIENDLVIIKSDVDDIRDRVV